MRYSPMHFAVVREAARRAIGLRHFDVQLTGGAALHDGKVAEMKTGEGKTLVATLSVYLNALEGKGVHVVTVNDYLARRDAAWMGKVYSFLGLSVGCLQHESSYLLDAGYRPGGELPEMRTVPRKEAYEADITYGTNNEFGFDYLRDNMAASLMQKVQRGLHYAIVDEVDNILIDEARTPLIISGPSQEPIADYGRVAREVARLRGDDPDPDFTVFEKERQVVLTEPGIRKVEGLMRRAGLLQETGTLYDYSAGTLPHLVDNALRSQFMYQRDKDYVVKDGEVVIVDEFTGRLMPGRRYGEGLHQAIEAKENVKVQRETITYATVTLQNYFRMYAKLSGMTGTAVTEAEEFFKVYGLEVIEVPTNEPMVREDHPDLVYKTHAGKFKAVVDHIEELNAEGRPVLVGTTSIERSEQLSGLLRRRGIKHEVLNAKNHEREAHIVAGSGEARRRYRFHEHGGTRHRHHPRRRPFLRDGTGRVAACTRGGHLQGRPLRHRHRAARITPHRQPAARTLRTPRRPRRDTVLRFAGRRDHDPVLRRHGRTSRGQGVRGRRSAGERDAHQEPGDDAGQGRVLLLRHPQAPRRVRRRGEPPAGSHLRRAGPGPQRGRHPAVLPRRRPRVACRRKPRPAAIPSRRCGPTTRSSSTSGLPRSNTPSTAWSPTSRPSFPRTSGPCFRNPSPPMLSTKPSPNTRRASTTTAKACSERTPCERSSAR